MPSISVLVICVGQLGLKIDFSEPIQSGRSRYTVGTETAGLNVSEGDFVFVSGEFELV